MEPTNQVLASAAESFMGLSPHSPKSLIQSKGLEVEPRESNAWRTEHPSACLGRRAAQDKTREVAWGEVMRPHKAMLRNLSFTRGQKGGFGGF